jgi:hypothetical protein
LGFMGVVDYVPGWNWVSGKVIGVAGRIAGVEGIRAELVAERKDNAKQLRELRITTQEQLRMLKQEYGHLFDSMLKKAASEMRQEDLVSYVPNSVILEFGLPIMAAADRQLSRAPIAVVSDGRVVYRAETFSKRCSLENDGLCNLVRSAVMKGDFSPHEEYEFSRNKCDLFVGALPSSYSPLTDSGSYLIRMVPLGAGRNMLGDIGEAAVRHIRKTMGKLITLDGINLGGECATD